MSIPRPPTLKSYDDLTEHKYCIKNQGGILLDWTIGRYPREAVAKIVNTFRTSRNLEKDWKPYEKKGYSVVECEVLEKRQLK